MYIMNYITNQTNQVIAADDSLLELLHVENIEKLSTQIALGNIHFAALTEECISITTDVETFTFDSHTSVLSSVVGSLNLISLKSVDDEEESNIFTIGDTPVEDTDIKDEDVEPDTPLEPVSESHDDLLFIKEEKTATTFISPEEPALSYDDEIDLLKESDKEEEEKETLPISTPELDDDFMLIKEDTEATTFMTPEEPTISTDDEVDFLKVSDKVEEEQEHTEDALLGLTIPQAPEDMIDEISITGTEEISQEDDTPKLDTTPIIINVEEVSQNIGISSEDYKIFLNEYIDTAISLEDDLQSDDTAKQSSAIGSLTQLSEVLQLPLVNEVMAKISTAHPDHKNDTIESFYAILARLVTHQPPVSQKELPQEELQIEESQPMRETTPVSESKGFGTINLDDVQAIHFDFQLEEAANDLSLPVSLIEEFVHDFIDQAHVETEKMLVAYEKGDLDGIQKIGHMLKGASSNLRIGALSDTLYNIQFCEDSNLLEDYIKQYWGHFLSFEQQIDILSK